MSEPIYPCPKCGKQFPMSQMYTHYQTCQGSPQQTPMYPNQFGIPQTTPQYHNQVPMYIPPPTPEHRHQWFENDTYKVCLDQSCKQIKMKMRGVWFLFTRYGLKLFWINFILTFALNAALFSYLGIHH
jgi:hypothetical protein